MLNATWVRLAPGRLVRADRIVGVRPERTEGPAQGRWADPGNVRIMVCLDVAQADTEDDPGASWWQEAAVCHQDSVDVLVANLLNLMARAAAASSGPRFIYPILRAEDLLDRWADGAVLPPISAACHHRPGRRTARGGGRRREPDPQHAGATPRGPVTKASRT